MSLSSQPPAAALVFQTLLTQGPLTRAELGRRTGLSSGAVTKVSTPLLADGWITEVGQPSGERQPGRPATLVAVRPERARFVGVKVTGDELIGVAADLTATPLATRRAALGSREVGAVVRAIARMVASLADGEGGPAVHSVGVTISGDVDGHTGVVRYSPFLDWRGVRLAELVEAETGIPTVIDNDVRALTVAEQWFGAGAGLSSFALVTVGAGIGCGISVDGRLVSGAHGVSGEIGHLPVGGALGSTQVCTCGNTGCVEAVASTQAIVDQAREETGNPGLTLADAVRLAHNGDEAARAVFTRAGHALGLAIASVANLIGPERIIISGEGVASYDLFADQIRASFTAQAFGTAADCDLVVRPLPFEAWARGGAAVAAQRLFAPMAAGPASAN
ncbi:ROK family transcriptional regulator [Streptomyces fuscigenes]|uniref:ROK family transcriptional regulator n=1 Tax=Streptomyces fuscigenes TaxID=1528880 RepID=UPI001F3B0993|nr:ROK family transcriptional regulator [Streptomyces fuscigenes]MCF3963563.1 ROK family transcriptional regulator [Streptomyces fuscigenes]